MGTPEITSAGRGRRSSSQLAISHFTTNHVIVSFYYYKQRNAGVCSLFEADGGGIESVLRSWVQIPPGPFLSARGLRY